MRSFSFPVSRRARALFPLPPYLPPMNTAYELFGADIAVGNDMQALVAANGELILCEGCGCAVQNVALRLYVLLGSLFYDIDYGSLVLLWIREENTRSSQEALCVEIEARVNIDPHISPGSATCRVESWNPEGVELALSFTLVEQGHPDHLVLRLGEDNGSLALEIAQHANPREDSRP